MVKENLEYFTCSIQSSISADTSLKLEELYGSSYAVKAYVDIYHSLTQKYTLTIFESPSVIRHIFIFEMQSRTINVLNNLCKIENKFIELFCLKCFENFERVNSVSFTNLYIEPKINSLKFYISRFSDDYVIFLPEHFEAYRSMLGRNIKRNLASSINRVKRDFPDFDFTILEKEEIPFSLIENASVLSKKRMKEKGRVSAFTRKEVDKYYRRMQAHGYVSRLMINGKVATVIINTVVKEKLYFHVVAHDPKYNYYRLGQVALYLTIQSFIEKGGKEFHLLWGEYSYKYKFMGEKAILYSFEVLRDGRWLKWKKLFNRLNNAMAFLQSLTFKRIYRYIKKRIGKRVNSTPPHSKS